MGLGRQNKGEGLAYSPAGLIFTAGNGNLGEGEHFQGGDLPFRFLIGDKVEGIPAG